MWWCRPAHTNVDLTCVMVWVCSHRCWSYLCDGVGLLSSALRQTGGVGQGEDDGPLIVFAHGGNHLLREGSCYRSRTCRQTVPLHCSFLKVGGCEKRLQYCHCSCLKYFTHLPQVLQPVHVWTSVTPSSASQDLEDSTVWHVNHVPSQRISPA